MNCSCVGMMSLTMSGLIGIPRSSVQVLIWTARASIEASAMSAGVANTLDSVEPFASG